MCLQCGWCGAINKLSQQQHHLVHASDGSAKPRQVPDQQHPLLDHLSSQQQHVPQVHGGQAATKSPAAAGSQQISSQQPEAAPTINSHLQQQLPAQHQVEQHLQTHVQPQQSQLHPQHWQLYISNEHNCAVQQHQHQQQQCLATTGDISSHRNIRSRSIAQFCKRCISYFWRWLIICIVLLIISSVTGIGVFMLLPRLCTTYITYLPNLAVAASLVGNIVFYYAASVLQSPGSVAVWVARPPRGPRGEVLQVGHGGVGDRPLCLHVPSFGQWVCQMLFVFGGLMRLQFCQACSSLVWQHSSSSKSCTGTVSTACFRMIAILCPCQLPYSSCISRSSVRFVSLRAVMSTTCSVSSAKLPSLPQHITAGHVAHVWCRWITIVSVATLCTKSCQHP